MPLELQVKLLRVLETGMLLRVGTSKETAADVRVIAATNRDPAQAVRQGRLREDLYHRINVFPIEVPPLRTRGDDIFLLAQACLDALNGEHRTAKTFSAALLESLPRHDWPGNVRELKNFVQRAFILTDDGALTARPVTITTASGPRDDAVSIPIGTSLAEADRQLIFATLKRCEGIKKRAAQVLGISSKTLYNRLEEYAAAGSSPLDDDVDEANPAASD